jgi:hypothetical protein
MVQTSLHQFQSQTGLKLMYTSLHQFQSVIETGGNWCKPGVNWCKLVETQLKPV